MRPLTLACASLAMLSLLSAPRRAHAATPEVITLSPGDTILRMSAAGTVRSRRLVLVR